MSDLTRRTVLGAAGLLGGTAAAADVLPPFGAVEGTRVELPPLHGPNEVNGRIDNPDPPARRLGVAVVGLGHLSLEQVLPGFGQAQGVRLAGLVSGHRDKARVLAAQHGVPERNLYGYADFDRIKDNPEIEAVYVVLPNAMHEEFVTRAAGAGKHVLCEKPMATSSAEAERMIAACRDANVKLMIAYRMQYEATQRATVALARDGSLGDLRLIQAVNGQNDVPGQWRQVRAMAGGGSVPDVGIYCFNAFRYLTGEEPVEVRAALTRPAGDPRFREVEDVAEFTLAFPSGVMGVGTSGYSFHETRSLQVLGSKGSASVENAFAYSDLTLMVSRKVGAVNGIDHRRFPPKNQFATEMDHFARAVRADRTPHTPGEEGLQDMRIMEAIYRAAEGGSPVALPTVPGLDGTRGPAPEGEAG